MPQEFYDFDEARKHKTLCHSVWSRVIWVDDAGDDKLAVLHWMGGTYKVVGRYTADNAADAKAQSERCSAYGYCPSEPGDNDAYLAQINTKA